MIVFMLGGVFFVLIRFRFGVYFIFVFFNNFLCVFLGIWGGEGWFVLKVSGYMWVYYGGKIFYIIVGFFYNVYGFY